MREETLSVFPILDISIRSEDIRTQSKMSPKLGPNLACFSPQNFFVLGGAGAKFLDQRYKI